MKKCIFTIAFLMAIKLQAQPIYNKTLLDTLTQIKQGNTIATPFATLYYAAIEITNTLMQTKTASQIAFIEKFEAKFGPFFFQSYKMLQNQLPQSSVWEFYYNHPNLNELQYKFIGMNSHINGDMWLALVNAHSYDSIIKHKSNLLQYQKAFNVFFDSILKTTLQYKKVKRLHALSLGLDKYIGRRVVYKWRKQAVNMALLWYNNMTKFKRQRNRLDKKMLRFNKHAIKYFK
jgi:hypothetical protein